MRTLALAIAVAAVSATTAAAQPQSAPAAQTSRQQERVDAILGTLFGDRTGSGSSLDAQWALGRSPLSQQRSQFESRLDADVRSGALTRAAADRAKDDYRSLVDLEARYGADRRFSAQERADLNDRYENLTRLVAEGGEGGSVSGGTSVADGRRDFETRVDESVRLRRLTRVQATQLKTDYASLIRVEADYMRDGVLSARERNDLETRLDGLDARVGDTTVASGTPTRPTDPASRLDDIARALPTSGLASAAQAQLRVEHEDLNRLAAAYRRANPSSEEQAYLDKRLSDLETRARVRR